jgi:hypothetical protein
MNYAALQAELAARGTDYLGTRGAQYINFARAQLDAAYAWPYLKTSATGTAGAGTVTIADLGSVIVVQDTANAFNVLPQRSEADLRACYGDLTLAGTPWVYYSPATGVLTGFPLGGTLRAAYVKDAPDLSGPTDSPLSPAKYHGLIVDMAVQMAYRDSDDHQLAEQLQAWIDRQTRAMVSDLFADQPSTETALVGDDC